MHPSLQLALIKAHNDELSRTAGKNLLARSACRRTRDVESARGSRHELIDRPERGRVRTYIRYSHPTR